MNKSVLPCDCCTKVINQEALVQTPLEICADVKLGDVETKCCELPEIVVNQTCSGCRLLVKQVLTVKIPLHYSADVMAQQSVVECKKC